MKKNYLDFISPVILHLYVKIKVNLTTRNDVHTSMSRYKLMVQVFNFYIYNMDGFNSSQEPEQSALLTILTNRQSYGICVPAYDS